MSFSNPTLLQLESTIGSINPPPIKFTYTPLPPPVLFLEKFDNVYKNSTSSGFNCPENKNHQEEVEAIIRRRKIESAQRYI
jgi:hypothetical protein